MDAESNQIDLIPSKEVHLRLQFIHKPLKKNWYARKYPFLIQNEPFEYGLRVKNVGSESFSGATISEFRIESSNLSQEALSTPKLKPLNPGEECDIYFDRYTLWHEGSIGTRCTLVPDHNGEKLITYQHHRDHDTDEKYETENAWWQDYYCQSQQQLLQTRTNNLILLLTVITVIEATLGLKDSAKFIFSVLAWLFGKVGFLFHWLAS
ncbi:hypothetical protein AB4259_22515 [Vibrio amylolyticus]|uniref:hypothetical protein n=1 Tax=Vibrio amylolyticus TaxID=2847292 RepID=UPI00355115B5